MTERGKGKKNEKVVRKERTKKTALTTHIDTENKKHETLAPAVVILLLKDILRKEGSGPQLLASSADGRQTQQI
jgi:hypothetical protein